MVTLLLITQIVSQPLYKLDEVVVTATRYPAPLKDVAIATIVIDREEIRAQNAQTIGEILKHSTGIDIKEYGDPASVSSVAIRGIQSGGILVLLNGHPLNSITSGMADLNSININLIERIEILKGPASSLYGANALGGVVNIITIKNYDKPEYQLKLNSATTDLTKLQTNEVFMSAGLPFKKINLGIAGGYNSAQGVRSNSDYTKHHLQGTLAYNSANVGIISTFTYDKKEYGVPGPVPLVDSLHPAPPSGDSTATSLFDRERDKIVFGDVNINWHLSNKVRIEQKLFADRKSIHFHSAFIGDNQDTIPEDYDYMVHTVGMNTMTFVDLKETDFVLGIDANYDSLKTDQSSLFADTVWSASSYNIGTWLEFKSKLNDVSTITTSIRFDRNSEFGNFFSPQLGFTTFLTQRFLMKVSAGKAFRAPTFNDLFWPKSGNPDLEPEHGWAYELRVESAPIHNSFLAISLFIRNVKDRITWLPSDDPLADPWDWKPQNVNYVSIKGLEIETNTQINKMVDISLDATFLNAFQKNSEVVYDDWMVDTGFTIIEEIERDAAFTPKHSISSKLNLYLPKEFRVNLTGQYVGERVNYYPNYENYPYVSMDTKTLDRYFICDVNINKKVFKYFLVTVGIENLFDVNYATQFGYSLDDCDFPMPGRRFSLRLFWSNI